MKLHPLSSIKARSFGVVLLLTFLFQALISPPAHAAALIFNIDAANNASWPSHSGATISDSTGNASAGTATSVTYSSAGGGSFVFGGASYISFPSYNFGSAFSVVAWVNPNSTNSTINTIIANGTGGLTPAGFKMYWNSWNTSDKNLIVEAGNGSSGGAVATSGGNVISNNTWYQIVYELDTVNQTVSMYVNKSLKSSSGTVVASIATNQAFKVGMFADSSYGMYGSIGKLEVYNNLLSTSDISSDYSSNAPRFGLVAALGTPLAPSVSNIQSNQISVTGSAVANASSYLATIYGSDSTTVIETQTITTANIANPTSLAGLNPYSNYFVSLIAQGDGVNYVNSLESTKVAFTTAKGPTSISLADAQGGSALFRTLDQITATLTGSTTGKVSFFQYNKAIPGCKGLIASSSTVRCNFKAALHGNIPVYATFIPSQSSLLPSTSVKINIVATLRSNNR